MYSLLIVDDEPFVFQGLEKLIAWDEYGITLCPPCYNAPDAIEYLENHPVDILLTDIQMPELSGIGLLRYIKKQGYATRCLVLSGYDDFEYVKAAAILGIENYFLKPVNAEELSSTLVSIVKSIQKEKQEQQLHHHFLQENFLHAWLNNSIDPFQIEEKAEIAELNIHALSFCAVIFDFRHQNSPDINRRISALISRRLEEHRLGFCIAQNDACLTLVLLGYGHVVDEAETVRIAERLNYDAMTECGAGALVCIGSVETSQALLYRSFWHAQKLHRCAMLLSSRPLLFSYDEIFTNSRHYFSTGLLQELRLNIILQKQEQIVNLVKAAFPPNGTYITSLLQNSFLFFLSALFSELDPFQPPSAMFEELQENGQFFEINTVQDMVGAIGRAVSMLRQKPESTVQDSNDYVSYLIDYVRQHFAEPISLKLIGNAISVSPSYLGQLFLNAIGMPFSAYLNEFRIQYAQNLLRNTNMKIVDIGVAVGFNTTNYFTTIFRKFTDLTPTEYKLKYQSDVNVKS